MIIDQRVSRRRDKVPTVPQVLRRVPDQLDNLGRSDERIAFLINLEVLVSDQIEQNRVERRGGGELVGALVAGTHQGLRRGPGKEGLVLAVGKKQTHADGGGGPVADVRNTTQNGAARPP